MRPAAGHGGGKFECFVGDAVQTSFQLIILLDDRVIEKERYRVVDELLSPLSVLAPRGRGLVVGGKELSGESAPSVEQLLVTCKIVS